MEGIAKSVLLLFGIGSYGIEERGVKKPRDGEL